MGGNDHEASGDRDVLQKHDALHLVFEVEVKEQSRCDGTNGEGEPSGMPAEHDGQCAPDFQYDHLRQQHSRHSHRCHVSQGSGKTADFVEARQRSASKNFEAL